MSYETYRLIHLFAIISLFLSIGAFLVYSGNNKKLKKNVMILHGLAGLLLFVSGFGLIARLKMHSFPMWVILKIGVWIILTVLIPIVGSKKINKKWIWLLVFASGFSAIYLAVLKPFI